MNMLCSKCGRPYNGWQYNICNVCFEKIIKNTDILTPSTEPLRCKKCSQVIEIGQTYCHYCYDMYGEEKLQPTEEKAMRDNGNKLQYGLIAPEILTALAGPYTMGAKKYEPRNCEKPMSFTDLDSALERHMNSFRRGEETASDSGLSHLHHAIWNIGMMIMHLERGTLIDDRPKGCTPNDQYWKQPEGFYEYSGKGTK